MTLEKIIKSVGGTTKIKADNIRFSKKHFYTAAKYKAMQLMRKEGYKPKAIAKFFKLSLGYVYLMLEPLPKFEFEFNNTVDISRIKDTIIPKVKPRPVFRNKGLILDLLGEEELRLKKRLEAVVALIKIYKNKD